MWAGRNVSDQQASYLINSNEEDLKIYLNLVEFSNLTTRFLTRECDINERVIAVSGKN